MSQMGHILGSVWSALVLFVCITSSQAAVPLITEGERWNYHNTGALPGAGWYNSSFPESGWSNGLAPLGYPIAKGVSTVLSFGPNGNNKWAAYYFRKSFTVTNVAAVAGLVASFNAA